MSSRVPLTLRSSFFQDSFFKNAWEDFERLQSEMQKDSDAFWQRVNKQNAAIESSGGISGSGLNSSSSTTQQSTNSNQMMPFHHTSFPFPSFMSSRARFGSDLASPVAFPSFEESRLRTLDLFQHKDDDQVIRMKDDETKFEISLDTRDFRPDELKINITDGMLKVEGKHEEKGENKMTSKLFARQYTLPAECEIEKVNSNLSSDGILMITAPKKPKISLEKKSSTPIPIEFNKK